MKELTVATCPKCRHTVDGIHFCGGCYRFGPVEHFHRNCRTCHYEWPTKPTPEESR
jgi:hypothetical protein